MTATPVATGFSGSGLLNGNGNGNGRPRHQNLVIGAGPAGLTAGYMLAKHGVPATVLEAERPGRAASRRPWCATDTGSTSAAIASSPRAQEVEELWHEVLDDEFLLRPRMSRIYWNGRFLDYPLRGHRRDPQARPGRADARVALVHARVDASARASEETFEEWVSNRFGRRLFELFFRSYTEKVWGVPTSEIRAEWAAQRIKGLSFWSAAQGGVLRQPRATSRA